MATLHDSSIHEWGRNESDLTAGPLPSPEVGDITGAVMVPVIAWSRENMANFKVPRRVEVLDALPRNATGKVVKFELRERARA